MKPLRLLFLLIAAASLGFAARPLPNIVLIISDDQAWTDYGFMEHPVIQTPNLDKLADRSLVFERAYVAAAATGMPAYPSEGRA